jgi:hypothetical protein
MIGAGTHRKQTHIHMLVAVFDQPLGFFSLPQSKRALACGKDEVHKLLR